MKKIVIPLILMLACTGCGGQKTEQVQSVVEDGVLSVAAVNGMDQYLKAEQGIYTGIEADVLNRFSEESGIRIQYLDAADSEAAMQMVLDGTADAAVGRLSEVQVLAAGLTATSSYQKQGLYILTRTGNYADTLMVMAEQSVGISPSVSEDARLSIEGINDVISVESEDFDVLLSQLEEGTFSAVICTEREAKAAVSDSIMAQELLNTPKEYCVIALGADQTELCSQINQSIGNYLDEQAKPDAAFEEEE